MREEKDANERIKKASAEPLVSRDVSLSEYSREAVKLDKIRALEALDREVLNSSMSAGVTSSESNRSGTYFQVDQSIVYENIQKDFKDKLEVMGLRQALEKHDWLKDYYWKAISMDTDKYTTKVGADWDNGYFIRVLENQKVSIPFQSCLFISKENLSQNIHNIVIAEPNSRLSIITGCAAHPNISRALHLGVTESYVKENAELSFTMIHNWGPGINIRPRSATILEENASLVNNYVCLTPVNSLRTCPTAYCKGDNSRVEFNSILYGSRNSELDIGSKLVLEGRNTRGRVVSRAIAKDNSKILLRGTILGKSGKCKAHLECSGLLLSDSAVIRAIPELIGEKEGSELSHEAAVGKIAEQEIHYLMARGISEEDAISLIIRGFLDARILGLPRKLEESIKRMVDATAREAM